MVNAIRSQVIDWSVGAESGVVRRKADTTREALLPNGAYAGRMAVTISFRLRSPDLGR